MKGNTPNLAEIKEKVSKAAKEIYEQDGWTFEFSKGGIMPSNELDMLQDCLVLNAIPDTVYGENLARFSFKEYDFCIEFTPKDSLLLSNLSARQNSLRNVNANLQRYSVTNNITCIPSEVKVKFAEYWKDKKPEDPTVEVKNIQIISDVFFSSPYKGTIKKLSLIAEPQKNHNYLRDLLGNLQQFKELTLPLEYPFAEKTEQQIPIHNLTESNPIKWSNISSLWEDELGDTGYSMSEVRFRVMGDCWFSLLRHYLRVDEVLIRIYDTRYYHEFGQNYVLREFSVKEDSCINIVQKGFKFTPDWMLDQCT